MADITPDDKDWTWVLESVCPDCGYDVRSIPSEQIGSTIREIASQWENILAGDAEVLRVRPRPDTWSPLEYGAHVRDVFRIYLERLDLMLTEDGPRYLNWDQDETATAENYGAQDPVTVSSDLAVAAGALADRFDSVNGEQWDRTGFRSDGAAFTVISFARYLVHDPAHHIWDVTTT